MSDAARLLSPDPSPPEAGTTPPTTGTVRAAGWLAVGLAIFGLVLALALAHSREATPFANNIFFRQFYRDEPWHLGLLLAFGLALALGRTSGARLAPLERASHLPPLALAALVALVALLVWPLVMHATPFSMDEFAADFQARILAGGRFLGEIPTGWRPWVERARPVFVAVSPDHTRWVATYTPGYSLLRAPFEALGLAWLLNPLLGAAAVLLVHRVARALWPDEPRWAWTAAALLAAAPQLLVTAGSGYAMPAHLALNLAWLALYLRGTRGAVVALGLVGALALSLHNPFPHALFVAPFLLRLLRDRRWGTLAWLALAYGATSAALLGWLGMVGRFVTTATPAGSGGGGGLAGAFALPSRFHLFTLALAGLLLFTWHTPAVVLGWLSAARRPRALPVPLRDAALGVLLTLGFYAFYPFDQGHGWGYRYSYAVVGNLVLLATAGLRALAATEGERRVGRLVAASLVLSLLVQLPLRAVQVARGTAPIARSLAWIHALDADAVTVPVDSLWYGLDLLRNDPRLSAPVVLRELPPAALDSLRATRRVRVLTPGELTALGMERLVPLAPGRRFW